MKGTYHWHYALVQERSHSSIYKCVELEAGEELVIINPVFSFRVCDQGTLIGVQCTLEDDFVKCLEWYFWRACLDRRDGSRGGGDISHVVCVDVGISYNLQTSKTKNINSNVKDLRTQPNCEDARRRDLVPKSNLSLSG